MSPNPAPSERFPHPGETEREKELRQPEWSVTMESYRELGEAIASYNAAIGNDPPFGTATVTREDGHIKLVIELYSPIVVCRWNKKCGLAGCSKCGGCPF